MDKSLFEKYIAEMKEFKKRSVFKNDAVVSVIAEREDAVELQREEKENEVLNESEEQETEQMEGTGYLLVNVTSVRDLYPVPNAKITVFLGEGENRRIFAEGVTDISGKAGPFKLKAPAIEYSESPNSSLLPFAYYNILTSAEGFTDTIHLGVQVFDKVTSIQKVNLISSLNGGEDTIIINQLNKEVL